jgi:hypothetical protein
MRVTPTRTGSSLVALLVLLAPVALAGKKRQAPEAVVAGTVFREDGFSLPGAQVELSLAPGSQAGHKSKKMKAVSDARGEFAFRVPTDDLEYSLTATAPGFRPQQKSVRVSGEVRVDVFFSLEATERKEGK